MKWLILDYVRGALSSVSVISYTEFPMIDFEIDLVTGRPVVAIRSGGTEAVNKEQALSNLRALPENQVGVPYGLPRLDKNAKIPLSYLYLNRPGGLVTYDMDGYIDGSKIKFTGADTFVKLDEEGFIPNRLLRPNVIGDGSTPTVEIFDENGKIVLSHLYTNVANGLVTLDDNSKVDMQYLYTNSAGKLLKLDPEAKVGMEFLHVNKPNGLLGLDNKGYVPTNRIKTNEPFSLLLLDEYGLVPMDKLRTNVAGGVPVIRQNGKLDPKVIPYEELSEGGAILILDEW
jgi:hypothetical protein